MPDREDLRHIRHLAAKDTPRRVEEGDFWNLLAIIAIVATAVLASLPMMDQVVNDIWIRFILIMAFLMLLAMICLRMVLPKRSQYHETEAREVPVPVTEDGSMRRAMQGVNEDQLRQYRELQMALERRIVTRRRLDDDSWRDIKNDPGRCLTILGDQDLADLMTAEMIGVSNVRRLAIYGLAFDDDFETRFERLLKKVEDWR